MVLSNLGEGGLMKLNMIILICIIFLLFGYTEFRVQQLNQDVVTNSDFLNFKFQFFKDTQNYEENLNIVLNDYDQEIKDLSREIIELRTKITLLTSRENSIETERDDIFKFCNALIENDQETIEQFVNENYRVENDHILPNDNRSEIDINLFQNVKYYHIVGYDNPSGPVRVSIEMIIENEYKEEGVFFLTFEVGHTHSGQISNIALDI